MRWSHIKTNTNNTFEIGTTVTIVFVQASMNT